MNVVELALLQMVDQIVGKPRPLGKLSTTGELRDKLLHGLHFPQTGQLKPLAQTGPLNVSA